MFLWLSVSEQHNKVMRVFKRNWNKNIAWWNYYHNNNNFKKCACCSTRLCHEVEDMTKCLKQPTSFSSAKPRARTLTKRGNDENHLINCALMVWKVPKQEFPPSQSSCIRKPQDLHEYHMHFVEQHDMIYYWKLFVITLCEIIIPGSYL